MNPDLEMLLSADEEARARVETARRSAHELVDRAREEADRLKRKRARERDAALDREVLSIAEDTSRRVEERRRRRRQYVAGLSESSAERQPAAVDAWVRIVRDGPAPEGSLP